MSKVLMGLMIQTAGIVFAIVGYNRREYDMMIFGYGMINAGSFLVFGDVKW
ncbi:hypothetical protein ACUXVY_12760 [Chromobacterium haemolyticum]|uniref:hypothetical protein n=1 Tax=Chromobacterium haemolyticum TaxID=394935 RepID=UPI0040573E3E